MLVGQPPSERKREINDKGSTRVCKYFMGLFSWSLARTPGSHRSKGGDRDTLQSVSILIDCEAPFRKRLAPGKASSRRASVPIPGQYTSSSLLIEQADAA